MARLLKKMVVKCKPLKVCVFDEAPDLSKIEIEEVEYEERIEAQELFCQECQQYVRFPMNLSLDGNHEITCPKCGHVHYRVVKKGVITEDRYSPCSNMMTYQIATYQTTISVTSYSQDMSTDSNFTQQAWTDCTSACS